MLQVEEAYSKGKLSSERLHALKECISTFVSSGNLLASKIDHDLHLLEQEVIDFEQDKYLTAVSSSKLKLPLEIRRLFVVVMDYDPQSLCITGQPELELFVQSGKAPPMVLLYCYKMYH